MRPLREDDEEAMFAYQSDPEVVRYIPWGVRTREHVRVALAAVIGREAFEDTGDFLMFGIESREHEHAKFGGILDFGFAHGGLHRMTARMDVRNAASVAVCEKLGMRCEGDFIEDEWFKGEWSSTRLYAVLRQEWESAGGTRSAICHR